MKRLSFEICSVSSTLCRAMSSFLLCVAGAVACGPKLEPTAVEIGGGMRKGSPPMCYQYRGEARALSKGYDIWVHLNNTCAYSVDCTFFDDVTEQQNQFVMAAYQQQSVVLSRGSESKRVSIDAECVWKP
jgi:hypothetical protein